MIEGVKNKEMDYMLSHVKKQFFRCETTYRSSETFVLLGGAKVAIPEKLHAEPVRKRQCSYYEKQVRCDVSLEKFIPSGEQNGMADLIY
jgi:hypothetical protein